VPGSISDERPNNSQPTFKWNAFLDILSPSLQFPDETFTVLITKHAVVVAEEIQVGMKHVYLQGHIAIKFVIQ